MTRRLIKSIPITSWVIGCSRGNHQLRLSSHSSIHHMSEPSSVRIPLYRGEAEALEVPVHYLPTGRERSFQGCTGELMNRYGRISTPCVPRPQPCAEGGWSSGGTASGADGGA